MLPSKLKCRGLAAVSLVVSCWTGACEAPARRDDGHLLLIVERKPSGFRIAEAHVVETPLPVTRVPRTLGWRVEITDSAGQSLFSESIPESGIRRGAFANTDGTTESMEQRRETFSFALRLPLVRDAAKIGFFDTSPAESGGPQASGEAEPSEVELGAVAYPKDVR